MLRTVLTRTPITGAVGEFPLAVTEIVFTADPETPADPGRRTSDSARVDFIQGRAGAGPRGASRRPMAMGLATAPQKPQHLLRADRRGRRGPRERQRGGRGTPSPMLRVREGDEHSRSIADAIQQVVMRGQSDPDRRHAAAAGGGLGPRSWRNIPPTTFRGGQRPDGGSGATETGSRCSSTAPTTATSTTRRSARPRRGGIVRADRGSR